MRSEISGCYEVLENPKTGRPFSVGDFVDEGQEIIHLSDREFEVFEWIGRGLQTREVAEKLHLSPKTVDAHREHIKTKLKLESATELLTYAVRWVQLEQGS